MLGAGELVKRTMGRRSLNAVARYVLCRGRYGERSNGTATPKVVGGKFGGGGWW